MLIWDKGFTTTAAPQPNIIADLELQIVPEIQKHLTDADAFVNKTWIWWDGDLKKIANSGKRLICYSGADWDNSCERTHYGRFTNSEVDRVVSVWEQIELSKAEVIHIGNTRGNHYHSFWLEFVAQNVHKYADPDTLSINSNPKPFMCLNRKPHRHRIVLAQKLQERNLWQQGYVSLGGEEPQTLARDIVSEQGDAVVGGSTPDVPGYVGITNDIDSLGDPANWRDHFCNIVTETTVHTDVFITEKTFKPILGHRPFVILGDHNIYTQLQAWGFDTFDDVFGTGYNNPDWEQRTHWVCDVVKDLCADPNLHLLYKDLIPRLQHNRAQFDRAVEINRQQLKNFNSLAYNK
jgi:hypothetical protein